MKDITKYLTEGFFNNVQSMKMDLDSFRKCMKPYQEKDKWDREDDRKVEGYIALLLKGMSDNKVLEYKPGYNVYVRIQKRNDDEYIIGSSSHIYNLDMTVAYMFEEIWEMPYTVVGSLKIL